MPVMTSVTSRLRSAAEVADVRGYAREHLEITRPEPGEYSAVRVDAILAALDWVEGLRPTAPVSGEAVEPDAASIHREMIAANDAEAALRAQRRDGTWPGSVEVTLSWYLGRGAEPI